MNNGSSGMLWIKAVKYSKMVRFFLIFLFLFVINHTMARVSDDNFYFISSNIAEYTKAFDRCQKIIENRPYPDEAIIQKLKAFPQIEVERFLVSKSVFARHNCEKPEITDLAYAILMVENEQLLQKTKDIISASKILYFSVDYREFHIMYELVSGKMRQSLGNVDYFNQPFDDRLLLDFVF